jgi:hypothetical protein
MPISGGPGQQAIPRPVAGRLDPATLAGPSEGEAATMWVLLAVSTANVVLGVWRPRIIR